MGRRDLKRSHIGSRNTGWSLDQRIKKGNHLIRSLSLDVALSRRQLLVPGYIGPKNRAQPEGPAPFLKEPVVGKKEAVGGDESSAEDVTKLPSVLVTCTAPAQCGHGSGQHSSF